MVWLKAAGSIDYNYEPKKSSNHNNSEDIDFDDNSFEDSIKQARDIGVPEDKILKNKEDIDKYFTEK